MKKTLLCVDDSKTIRTIMQMVLSENEYHLVLASSLREAATLFAELPKLDVALIDLSLPGEDPYLFAQHLKEKSPETLLLAMHSQFTPHQTHLELFDADCKKPIDTQTLFENITKAELARAQRPSLSPSLIPTPPPLSSLNQHATPIKQDHQETEVSLVDIEISASNALHAPPPIPAHPAHPATPVHAAPEHAPSLHLPPPIPPRLAVPTTPPAPHLRPNFTPKPPSVRPQAAPPLPAASPIQTTQTTQSEKPSVEPLQQKAPQSLVTPPLQSSQTNLTDLKPLATVTSPVAGSHEIKEALSSAQSKLTAAGLTSHQADTLIAHVQETIEKIVSDLVPKLAEQIIRQEIERLTQES